MKKLTLLIKNLNEEVKRQKKVCENNKSICQKFRNITDSMKYPMLRAAGNMKKEKSETTPRNQPTAQRVEYNTDLNTEISNLTNFIALCNEYQIDTNNHILIDARRKLSDLQRQNTTPN